LYLSAGNHLPKVKQRVTLFATVYGAPPCCIQPNGDVNFISKPLQKFISGNSGVLKILYNLALPLSAASAATLNDHSKP